MHNQKRDSQEHNSLTKTVQLLKQLPKVELHLHLEGALRPQTVYELACKYEPESPLCQPDWQRHYWSFHDLSSFVVEFSRLLRMCVRSAADYYRLARECFEDLAEQQVVYTEVSFGPRTPGRPFYVSLEETLAAIDQARQEVEARTSLRVGFILGLSRDHLMPDEASATALACQWVREVVQAHDRGVPVVGIDLHGIERSLPDVGPFVPAFRTAAEAGLGRRAHAGEGAGPASVWECLRRLNVQRIAHGVRAVEDAELVAYLAKTGVALDQCPTSNIRLGVVPRIEQHPIRMLRSAGVVVTISSDDPIAFDTTVTAELVLLYRALGFSIAELRQLTIAAATHSFLPELARVALVSRLQEVWPSEA